MGPQSAWRHLPSQRKQYAAKRVVDRRFEGAKHKRTRDFGGGYRTVGYL